ncbi:unnamed protein product [Lactuca saligna]|uniref:Uncharacterized protein n=1 Tax=Lactuca saligna TaxID=75948 RepID=A0AA36DZ43_LACSI|nr:unnamed protein product [Lactuca saligna]
MCSSKEPPAEIWITSKASQSLKNGSPIIIVEALKMLKTTTSMPCLKVNSGLVKADDVGSFEKDFYEAKIISLCCRKSFVEIEDFVSVGMVIHVFHCSIYGVEFGDE